MSLVPAFAPAGFGLFVGGMLWLALWHGRVRLFGLVPVLGGVAALALARPPDLLVTGDGHNLGIVERDRLVILREGRTPFTRATMMDLAGISGEAVNLDDWPGARCNRDACLLALARGGRVWRVLVLRRGGYGPPPGGIGPACAAADIVLAPGRLGPECRPVLTRVDKVLRWRTGGLAFTLSGNASGRTVRTVADGEGEHPWWRFPHRMPRPVPDDDQ
ncbi:MAG: hypothetical protein KGM17_04195 [Sphingomonadales bacterium]|nr:hypothetical protein [Sphingomonadales bacterium]